VVARVPAKSHQMKGSFFGRPGATAIGPPASNAGSNMAAETAWAVGSFAVVKNMVVDRGGRFE
jgi:hypothetical protein